MLQCLEYWKIGEEKGKNTTDFFKIACAFLDATSKYNTTT